MGLDSLRRMRIAFTGFLNMTQAEARRHARQAGGIPTKTVYAETDILVQGRPNKLYKYGDHGIKLKRVDVERAKGARIYVITSEEFEVLLRRRRLPQRVAQLALRGPTSVLGVRWREPDREASPALRRLQTKVARYLRAKGLEIYAPPRDGICDYDMAWQDGTAAHAVTTRLLDDAEATAVHSGLGHALNLVQLLKDDGWRARGHLVLDAAPNWPDLVRTCKSARVTTSWPGSFKRIFK